MYAPGSGHPALNLSCPTPHRNLKLIESIWGLKIPRKRTCKHLRRPDNARTFSLIKNPSLYLERAVLHLNLHPYCSFSLTYRNHIARCPKSDLYAEVVCRKCGERRSDERRSHLDTSTAPVCPLFSQLVHSLMDLRV